MHKNITLICALLLACSSHGQVSIAPEAGFQMVSMSYPKGSSSFSDAKFTSRPSFRAGISMAVRTNKTISIHSGLFYAPKGYKLIYKGSPLYRIALNYVEVPVYINVTILNRKGNTLFAGLGPYIAYCLGGRSSVDLAIADPAWNSSGTKQLTVGNNADLNFAKPIDFGANVNLGFITSTGLYLRAQYSLGLVNVPPKGMFDNSMKNRAFGISVGYQIKTKSAPSSNR